MSWSFQQAQLSDPVPLYQIKVLLTSSGRGRKPSPGLVPMRLLSCCNRGTRGLMNCCWKVMRQIRKRLTNVAQNTPQKITNLAVEEKCTPCIMLLKRIVETCLCLNVVWNKEYCDAFLSQSLLKSLCIRSSNLVTNNYCSSYDSITVLKNIFIY